MFQPPSWPLTAKPRKGRKDRGQHVGLKWLGAGVTGPDILAATKKCMHCLACQGPYYQTDYPSWIICSAPRLLRGTSTPHSHHSPPRQALQAN